MAKISQSGSSNQASTGHNSPNIRGDKNRINFSKENSKWFLSGILLPVISGLIVEFLKEGKVSEILNYIVKVFK